MNALPVLYMQLKSIWHGALPSTFVAAGTFINKPPSFPVLGYFIVRIHLHITSGQSSCMAHSKKFRMHSWRDNVGSCPGTCQAWVPSTTVPFISLAISSYRSRRCEWGGRETYVSAAFNLGLSDVLLLDICHKPALALIWGLPNLGVLKLSTTLHWYLTAC